MTIEELNNLHKEERRLWGIHQQRVTEAEVARDTWYVAYRAWIDAEESMTLNKRVEEIIARERVYTSTPDEAPRSFDNG